MNVLTPRFRVGFAAGLTSLFLVLNPTCLAQSTADAPVPNVGIVEVEKGELVRKNPGLPEHSSTIKGTNLTTAVSDKTTSAGEATYTIKLHNFSKFPAKDIVVEYRIYTISRNIDNQYAAAPTVGEIQATEKATIEPGKDYALVTKPVPFEMSQTQTTTTTGTPVNGVTTLYRQVLPNGETVYTTPNNVSTTSSTASTSTTVLGWHVEVRYNGKVIKSTDEPGDLPDKLKNTYHYGK